MTDRDHFAAAALAGLLVHANDDIDEETLDTPSDIAYTAYQMADAMLRERCRSGSDCPGDAAPGPQPTLTDAEREAIGIFAAKAWTGLRWGEVETLATALRGLLERMK